MNRVHGINLDFNITKKIETEITYKQYDVGSSFLAIQLLHDNKPINVENDVVMAIFKHGSSIVINKNNDIVRSVAYIDDESEGVILLPIPNEVLENATTVTCELVILQYDGSRRTSPAFTFKVVKSLSKIDYKYPSQSELLAICGRFLCGQLKSSENVEVFRLNDDGSYTPTEWYDYITPVNAKNLNKIENALHDLSKKIINLNSSNIAYKTSDNENVSTVKDGIDNLNNNINNLSNKVEHLDLVVNEDLTNLNNKVDGLDVGLREDFNNLNEKIENLDCSDIPYTTSSDDNITTLQDALDKLLYSPLTISLNANVGTLHEKGSVINSINFTWSYNKKILSQMFDNNVLNISSRNYLYSTLTNNKTFTLRANDGKSDFTKSLSFSFIYPIYIGSIDSNITIPSENNIKQMTKRLVTPSSQSFSYTVNNKRMCICVPNNWTINSIIDPNNFNITSSFKQSNININCLDGTIQSYKLYLSEPTSQTSFTVKFNT